MNASMSSIGSCAQYFISNCAYESSVVTTHQTITTITDCCLCYQYTSGISKYVFRRLLNMVTRFWIGMTTNTYETYEHYFADYLFVGCFVYVLYG